MTFNPNLSRVKNLASVVRFALKLIRLIAGLLASTTSDRLTAPERNAIVALQAAIDALLDLLPAPGVDSSPGTVG